MRVSVLPIFWCLATVYPPAGEFPFSSVIFQQQDLRDIYGITRRPQGVLTHLCRKLARISPTRPIADDRPPIGMCPGRGFSPAEMREFLYHSHGDLNAVQDSVQHRQIYVRADEVCQTIQPAFS
jgi:hypothetical protein